MNIACISDLHLTDGDRLPACVAVLSRIAEKLSKQPPDLIVLCGDLSGRDSPHRMTYGERLTVHRLTRELSDIAPVDIVRGNHDVPMDLFPLKYCAGRYPVTIITNPWVRMVDNALDTILYLPWLPIREYVDLAELCSHKIPHTEWQEVGNRNIQRLLDLNHEALGGQLRWVIGHLPIQGFKLECGAIIESPRDLHLDVHQLAKNNPSLHSINLGHIHKRYFDEIPGEFPQYITHIGSPYATDYSEGLYPKGFLWISSNQTPVWIDIREGFQLFTIRWNSKHGWKWDTEPGQYDLEDAFVRIIVEAKTPNEIHEADYGAMEIRLLQCGVNGYKTEIRNAELGIIIDHELPSLASIDDSIRYRIVHCRENPDGILDLYERIKQDVGSRRTSFDE